MNANLGRSFIPLCRRAILPLTFLLAACAVSPGADAGGTKFFSKPGAKVRIEGTSTIHDWQMESPMVGGYLEAGPGFPTKPGADAKPGKVNATVEAYITVRSL